MNRTVYWAGACAIFIALAGCSREPARIQVAGPSPYGQEGIRVSGTAIVRAEPDLAVITLGCVTRAGRAGQAKAQNDETMRRVMDAIEKHGVRRRDIQTVTYNLGEAREPRSQERFWQVVNVIEVRVRDVSAAADVIDAAADAGANRIGSVRYAVESLHKLRAKAREQASRVAREKAEQLAKLMNVRVGKTVAINDASYQTYYPWNWYGGGMNANVAQSVTQQAPSAPGREEPDDQLASGLVSVEAREEVVFAIE
jgi:uncharacterized protein YggE